MLYLPQNNECSSTAINHPLSQISSPLLSLSQPLLSLPTIRHQHAPVLIHNAEHQVLHSHSQDATVQLRTSLMLYFAVSTIAAFRQWGRSLKGHFRFLDLPPEIREVVYGHHLALYRGAWVLERRQHLVVPISA